MLSHNIDDDDDLFLKDPETKKELLHGQTFAFAGMQGWRKSNEDFHKHLVPINEQQWKLWSYFAIFDGHNGLLISFLLSNLYNSFFRY